jgi:hypothetical protein
MKSTIHPHHLRLFGLALALPLLAAIAVLWSTQTTGSHQTVGDFQPTLSPQEAAVRIAAAQEAEQQQRMLRFEIDNPHDLPAVRTVYFPQTGHHLSNRAGFLDFWRSNGQVTRFGYPVTEELTEDGRVVQYFERARLEYHPDLADTPWHVQLGHVGREVAQQNVPAGFFDGFPSDPLNGSRYFPATGHTIFGKFLTYWQEYGGVDSFGYPITEEYQDADTGLIVQWFERARFEYHPENGHYTGYSTLNEVMLSDVGRQAAHARDLLTAPVARMEGVPDWSPALWPRSIEINLSTQQLTAYEGDLVVHRAPVATGRPGFDTPPGNFAVYDKLVSQTMTGSAGGETWNVPHVPWVMYIYGGVALHGTYWHNTFGTGYRPSHGCINLPMDHAQWLFEWADVGVPVRVHW